MKIANVSIFVGVFLCGLVADSAPLYAQAVDEPNMAGGENMPWNKGITEETRTAARAVFLEGNRLFKIPLFSQAVEKYTEAISKWRHPAFYFNLAIAEINLSQYLEARENLEEALKYGPDPLREDRFQEAKKQLVEVERHLGRIRVSCPTPGAEITLDGVPLFTGPGSHEVWVKAQAHEVAAKKPQYVTQSKHVTVSSGALEALNLSLRKLIEDRPWAAWKPWAIVGAGVVIVAAGGGAHALSARKFNDYDNKFLALQCANSGGCMESTIRPTLRAELSRARLEQKIAIGGYIAGGSLLAAGAVLLYLNRPHLMELDVTDSPARGVTVIPTVSTNMLGLQVTVSH